MGESDIEGKLAAMEVRVSEIAILAQKIDKLTDSINTMNLALATIKNDFVAKGEFKAVCDEYDKRFDAVRAGQNKLFWTAIGSGFVFIVWLLQRLLDIQLKVGG